MLNFGKRDWMTIFIRTMDLITWTLIFIGFIYFDRAKPQTQTILDMHYDKMTRESWNLGLAGISLWFFIAAVVLSLLGLLINLGFIGDKKHHISHGLIASLIVAFIASCIHLFFVF